MPHFRVGSIISGMRSLSFRQFVKALAGLALFGLASAAWGQVYKCTDAAGKTTYSSTACDAAAKPYKIPEDPKASATNPNVCAQLLDEHHRLEAERTRDAQRGKAETAQHAAQREKVAQRYSERCVSVTRSVAPPDVVKKGGL